MGSDFCDFLKPSKSPDFGGRPFFTRVLKKLVEFDPSQLLRHFGFLEHFSKNSKISDIEAKICFWTISDLFEFSENVLENLNGSKVVRG